MNGRRDLNYFSNRAFVNLDVKRGILRSRGGTRMVGVSEDFLRGFVTACEDEAGSAAPFILRRCGHFFGSRLARRFETELAEFAGQSIRDRTMNEFDALVRDMWHGCGFGQIQVDWSMGAHGFIPVRLTGSPTQDIGPSGHVGEDIFNGILEGFFSNFGEGELRCVQTGDQRLGDRDGTTFILSPFDMAKRVEGLVAEKTPHPQILATLCPQS